MGGTALDEKPKQAGALMAPGVGSEGGHGGGVGPGGHEHYHGSGGSGPGGAAAAPGAGSAVAGPAHPSPATGRHELWRAAARDCSFDRKLALIGAVLHSATQVVSLMSWPSLPFHERFQRLLSIPHSFGVFLAATFHPIFYIRWRKEILMFFRITFFMFPLLRKPAGIQHVLDADPHPGMRGVARDVFRIVWGSRLMAVIMASLANPLPLLPLVPHMLLQVYSVVMVRANGTLCAAPLLTHPLTVGRIHSFHSSMHLLASVLPGGVGQLMKPLLDAGGQERECEAFLSFLSFLTGLLLPIALLVKTEPPTSLRRWEDASAESGSAGASSGSGSSSAGLQARSRGGGLQAAWGRASGALEAAIRQLCGRSWLAPAVQEGQAPLLSHRELYDAAHVPKLRASLQSWERGIAWWLLLSLLWALSVATAR